LNPDSETDCIQTEKTEGIRIRNTVHKILIAATLNYLVSEPAEGAEPASVLEPEDLQGGGDNHLLLFVVGRGNTLECLQPLQGQLPALSLVGRHSADSPADMRNGNYQGMNSPADMGDGKLSRRGQSCGYGTRKLSRRGQSCGYGKRKLSRRGQSCGYGKRKISMVRREGTKLDKAKQNSEGFVLM
jgi:hypothetical protein